MSSLAEMETGKTRKYLEDNWKSLENPISFRGPSKVSAEIKRTLRVRPNKTTIEDFLAEQDAYTLNFKRRRRFPKRQVVTNGLNDLAGADLADVSNLSKWNDGVKFLLVVINCFSRFLYLRPVKDKKAVTVAKAMSEILKSLKVRNIWTDFGGEFVSKEMKKLLTDNGIKLYHTYQSGKSVFAERAIREIRRMIQMYLTANNTKRYVDKLEDFAVHFNNSVNRTLGLRPNEVSPKNEHNVWHHLYMKPSRRKFVVKFQVGDHVRISRDKGQFAKESEDNFTQEIFRVSKVSQKKYGPVMYVLTDLHDSPISGKFYDQELVHTKLAAEFKISKIIRTRRRGGRKECYVSFIGYDSSFNTWIPSSDIHSI